MDATMQQADGMAVRKRGAKTVAIAILIVVLLLLMMGFLRPDRGAYPAWLQALVHSGWLAAVITFALGLFHTIVGAPGIGPFRLVRTPIAIVLGLCATVVGAMGGWVLHAGMQYDGDRTADSSDDVDWDWD